MRATIQSARWRALRDAAARASHVVCDAQRDLARADESGSTDDLDCARAVLRSARSLRALALWEMRRQGRADAAARIHSLR